MDDLIRKFNAGVNFDELNEKDVAGQFCVLLALKYSFGHGNRLTRRELIDRVASIWFWKIDSERKPPKDRKIRKIINQLRKRGALICSTGGREGGYWIAGSQEEHAAFVKQELTARLIDLAETIRAQNAAQIVQFGGQAYLWKDDLLTDINETLYGFKRP